MNIIENLEKMLAAGRDSALLRATTSAWALKKCRSSVRIGSIRSSLAARPMGRSRVAACAFRRQVKGEGQSHTTPRDHQQDDSFDGRPGASASVVAPNQEKLRPAMTHVGARVLVMHMD